MDHCFTHGIRPSSASSPRLKAKTAAYTKYGTEANASPHGTTDISHWLSLLLRSLYYLGCVSKTKCSVPISKTDVCKKMRVHISDECRNAFIDGESLKFHEGHMCRDCGYSTDVTVEDCGKKSYLAYHNPGGVYLEVFPYNEGEKKLLYFVYYLFFSTVINLNMVLYIQSVAISSCFQIVSELKLVVIIFFSGGWKCTNRI